MTMDRVEFSTIDLLTPEVYDSAFYGGNRDLDTQIISGRIL